MTAEKKTRHRKHRARTGKGIRHRPLSAGGMGQIGGAHRRRRGDPRGPRRREARRQHRHFARGRPLPPRLAQPLRDRISRDGGFAQRSGGDGRSASRPRDRAYAARSGPQRSAGDRHGNSRRRVGGAVSDRGWRSFFRGRFSRSRLPRWEASRDRSRVPEPSPASASM